MSEFEPTEYRISREVAENVTVWVYLRHAGGDQWQGNARVGATDVLGVPRPRLSGWSVAQTVPTDLDAAKAWAHAATAEDLVECLGVVHRPGTNVRAGA